MGYFDNIYEDEQKKKKPSQVAAKKEKVKQAEGGQFSGIFEKTTTTSVKKATPTPTKAPTVTPEPKGGNSIANAINSIKKIAQTAIDTVQLAVKGPVSPLPVGQDTPSPVQAPQGKSMFNLDNQQEPKVNIPLATETVQAGSATFRNFDQKTPVKNAIDVARAQASDVLTDFATQGLVSKTYAPASEYMDDKKKDSITRKYEEKGNMLGTISEDAGLAIAGLISGVTGGIVKPKEVKTDTIQDKVIYGVSNVLGAVASIKKITGVFDSYAKGSATIGQFVDKYPKVGKYVIPYAKNILALDIYGQLDPDTQDRFKKLATDTLAGAIFTGAGSASAPLSIPGNFAIGFGLAKLSGASDEDAFISGGILSVLDGLTRTRGALMKSSFKKGELTMTPEEMTIQANQTNFKGSPAQDIMNKAAAEARAKGMDLKINLEAAQKSRVAKAFDAKTPEGFSFSIELVPKKTIELLKEEGASQQKAEAPKETAQEVVKTAKEPGIPENLPPVIREAITKEKPISIPTEFRNPTEEKAFTQIKTDQKKIVDNYLDKNNNEVDPDRIRTLLAGYKGFNVAEFNRPVGKLKDYIYEKLLDERKGEGNNTVLITAGGSGSGKTTGLAFAGSEKSEYPVVLDSTFSYEGAVDDVKSALDNGYEVELLYTVRDPIKSWTEGVLPRIKTEGRIVSEEYFLKTHRKAKEIAIKLFDKYGKDPKVVFEFINNTEGEPKLGTIDTLKDLKYNEEQVAKEIAEATEKAYENKDITKEQYEATKADRRTVILGGAEKGNTEPQKTSEVKPQVKEESKPSDTVTRLTRQIGNEFTVQEPVGSLWKSKGNTLYIKLNRKHIGGATAWLKKLNIVENAQEAGGDDVIKVVLKDETPQSKPKDEKEIITDPVRVQEIKNSIAEGENLLRANMDALGKPLTSEKRTMIQKSVDNARSKIGLKPKNITVDLTPKKKQSFATKDARRSQEIFVEGIAKAGFVAKSQEELIENTENYIEEKIQSAGKDKEVLKGLRTAINKEMFGYSGYTGNFKADYAQLKTMQGDPDIGGFLTMLEVKVNKIDEMLTTEKGPTGYASIGDYASLPKRTRDVGEIPVIEFPEMVRLVKELTGKYPSVGAFRNPNVKGRFYTKENGVIKLNPTVFKDATQAAGVLAHELGHLVDYLPEGTMKRGNLLGRIASLNKYLKTMLAEFPGEEVKFITPKDREKIRAEAKKAAKGNFELVEKEIEVGKEPTTPQEILEIWNSNTQSIKSKELLSYIQGLDGAQKKQLVINAMRGKVPEWVDFMHTVKKTVTEKVLRDSPQDIRKIYKQMLKQEIIRRRLVDLESVKSELQLLSQKWRPYNPNLESKEFVQYRNSSTELYADALSILFNDPALLKEEAPTFWNAFFNYLDTKPEVKDEMFKTWDILNKGEEAVFQERQKNVEEMFDTAEKQFVAKELEKQKVKTNFVYMLKVLFNNKNETVIRKVNEARKAGNIIDAKKNPIYSLEGLNYLDGKIEVFMGENYQELYERVQKLPEGMQKLGSVLLYERAINERGEMANPLGFDPKTAQAQLDGLKKDMPEKEWNELQEILGLFRKSTENIIKMAEDAQFYSPELLDQMKANKSYATFQVIDYLDTYVSAHVYKSIGTLKEIANPATSSVMKGISVMKAIERNNAKKDSISFFKEFFPKEIEGAKSVYAGKGKTKFIDPEDQNQGIVRLIEGGKMEAYYLPKDVADTLNGYSTDTIRKAAKVARVITGSPIYRPLFTAWNIGFGTFNFVRDFQRYWSNVPDYTLGDAITSLPRAFYRYGQSVPAAYRRATGRPDTMVKEMQKLGILGASYSEMFAQDQINPEEAQIDRLMRRYGLLEKTKKNRLLSPMYAVLDAVETYNNFIEGLPKLAGYRELKGKMNNEELADFMRTAVGSPNFRVKGTLTPVTNSVFLFSNAIKEGIKADAQVASGKKGRASAASFWWKTILSTFLPILITIAGGLGLFGKWYKDRLDDISEYDKTNYTVIPTGTDENGKTTYLRVPRAETQRFLGGLFYKAMNSATERKLQLEDIFDVFDYGAGQLPNLSPAFTGTGALLSYLSGHNPYDAFRNRYVIPDTEFKAGFKYSLPIFIDWFSKSQGAGIILPSYLGSDPTQLEKFLALPALSNIIGRWYKVSDYGQTEKQQEIIKQEEQKAAQKTLETREKIDSAVKDYKSGPASFTRKKAIEDKLVNEVVGKPKTQAEKTEKTNLIKKFEMGVLYGTQGPLTDSLIKANTNAQKAELIYQNKEKIGKNYNAFIKDLLKKKIISDDVVEKLKNK